MRERRVNSVGVIGAGAMGGGIAQVAAQGGWRVQIQDVDPLRSQHAIDLLRDRLSKLVSKGKLSHVQAQEAVSRCSVARTPGDFSDCSLIIEAIVEDLRAKVDALKPLAQAIPQATLASNTSSLSITRLGEEIGAPQRTVGMHFFNPVPLMPLVEVIGTGASSSEHLERTARAAREWGKTIVRAKDTPGFIVNRVARGYYLEPLRMLDEGVAGVDEIDTCLKRMAGFRMGPFELMDLIGIDVNYAVSQSVWRQMGEPRRLEPHPLQRELVEQQRLGRKSKRGFYIYSDAAPVPGVVVERRSFELPAKLYAAVRRFTDASAAPGVEPPGGSITEQYVMARTLAAIINEAAHLLDEDGASEADIDLAMHLGTNYPRGPLEWAQAIGRHTCAALLRALDHAAGDGRFNPARWLVA